MTTAPDDPRPGGTLRYYGPGGMDHVDPACAYYAFSHQIIRLFTRQLFSYRTTLDESALEPAPDVALALPTEANGGLGANGRAYRIRLRDDVYWDTEPVRRVTADDFVRGFKRMCNPLTGAGALSFFTSTIVGMHEFASGYYDTMSTEKTFIAEAFARYQNTHDIPGITPVADDELHFTLLRPANDFLNILAMIFASPAPIEYDDYLPDSEQWIANIRSCGPYRLSEYLPDVRLRMERNPAWTQESDSIRGRHVERIDVKMAKVSDDEVRRAVNAGEADLSWGAPVISNDRVVLDSERRLGYALNPYLVFNFRSPNDDFAMSKLAVRQAITYAINKADMVHFLSDMNIGTVAEVAHTAIPYGNTGHRRFNLYPTAGDRGDPERCRRMLAEAGYPSGLRLRALFREDAPHDSIAYAYRDNLAAAGVEVDLIVAGGPDQYYRILQDPRWAQAGEWDITAPAWTPDWFGNNGRAYVQPMFQSATGMGTSNYGGYHNSEVDALIMSALEESDPASAANLWHAVDRRVNEDAAIVPILACEPTIPHITSARVRNALPMPQIDRWLDATILWLAESDADAEANGTPGD